MAKYKDLLVRQKVVMFLWYYNTGKVYVIYFKATTPCSLHNLPFTLIYWNSCRLIAYCRGKVWHTSFAYTVKEVSLSLREMSQVLGHDLVTLISDLLYSIFSVEPQILNCLDPSSPVLRLLGLRDSENGRAQSILKSYGKIALHVLISWEVFCTD